MSVSTANSSTPLDRQRSPFAAPQAAPAAAPEFSSERLDKVGYQVVGDVLFCRNDTDFSGICWMTGRTEDLVSARCYVSALGLIPLLSMLISPVISLVILLTLIKVTSWSMSWSVVVIAVGAGMFSYSLLNSLRRNFRMHYGISDAARKSQQREWMAKWLTRVWTALCMVTAIHRDLFVDAGSADAGWVAVRISMQYLFLWTAGAVGIHVVLRPRFLRPHITPQGNVYRVKGLTPEFLHAVNRKAGGTSTGRPW